MNVWTPCHPHLEHKKDLAVSKKVIQQMKLDPVDSLTNMLQRKKVTLKSPPSCRHLEVKGPPLDCDR